jgi:Prealbumin-like fold domain
LRKSPYRPRRRRWTLAAGLALMIALGIAIPVYALGASTFDAQDGNLVVDGIAETDWANAPNLAFGDDKPTGQTDDSFGNGTKEDTPVPSVIDGSIPNNKSDLTRFYVASENVGDHDFLYLAWERVQDPSGTTNMDFEFNQSSVLSGNGVTPVRTAGDVLIKYDLSQGGTKPSFGLHRWVTQGEPSQVCEASAKLPCWGKVQPLGAEAVGSVNTGPVTDPIRGVSLDPRTFGEAAIDLTAAGILDPTQCQSFGKAYLKSRSSDSFTAAVKDFIAPIDVNINNCKPDTIELRKVDEDGNPLAGALLELYRDDNGVPGLQTTASGSTPADTKVGDCTTALPDATCSFGGIITPGTYIGHEAAAPNGYDGAPDQSVNVTVDNVADTITLTFLNAPVPGTIKVHKQDDAATPNPLGGAEFKLVEDNAPTAADGQTAPGAEDVDTGKTCTTGADGNCQFDDAAIGDYWVVETKAPAGHFLADPQPATVELGSAPGEGDTVELTFVDPRSHKVIVITCHEGTDTLAPGEVTVDGVTKSTLTTAPAGITEAELCNLGGAAFGGKNHGVHPATIDIAGH